MRKQRIDGQETRRKLLTAACEVFAKKGFRDATIAEICRQAKTNVASANYHFGGKEALYVESWRFAFEKSLQNYPPDGGVAPDSPVEDRLRGRILSVMRRIIDPQSHELDIFYKEMANPTGLLAGTIQQSIEPVFRGFAAIVRELLGQQTGEQKVRLCLMSIRAQCFGPFDARTAAQDGFAGSAAVKSRLEFRRFGNTGGPRNPIQCGWHPRDPKPDGKCGAR